MSFIWQPDKEQMLRHLRDGGMSFAAIAKEMGLTRNACIGKAQRLGLTSWTPQMTPEEKQRRREASARYKAKKRRERAAQQRLEAPRLVGMRGKKRNIVEFTPQELDVVPLRITLIDLAAHHCRYPYGDGPFTFCGHNKSVGSSYCSPHAFVCAGVGTAVERSAHRILGRVRASA